MKIRNGFVSNSSSSSFIINYPDKTLRLNEVEDYFGGYKDDIPDTLKDLMSYVLWKNQFNSEWERKEYSVNDCTLLDEEREIKCPYNYRECYEWRCEDNDCPYFKSIDKDKVIQDFIDNCWGDMHEQLVKMKPNIHHLSYLSIDDNNCDDDVGIGFNERYEINNHAGDIFKCHDNIVEEGK